MPVNDTVAPPRTFFFVVCANKNSEIISCLQLSPSGSDCRLFPDSLGSIPEMIDIICSHSWEEISVWGVTSGIFGDSIEGWKQSDLIQLTQMYVSVPHMHKKCQQQLQFLPSVWGYCVPFVFITCAILKVSSYFGDCSLINRMQEALDCNTCGWALQSTRTAAIPSKRYAILKRPLLKPHDFCFFPSKIYIYGACNSKQVFALLPSHKTIGRSVTLYWGNFPQWLHIWSRTPAGLGLFYLFGLEVFRCFFFRALVRGETWAGFQLYQVQLHWTEHPDDMDVENNGIACQRVALISSQKSKKPNMTLCRDYWNNRSTSEIGIIVMSITA